MARYSDQAFSLNTLGMTKKDLGELKEARELFERALSLARQEFALPRPDPEFSRINEAIIADNLAQTLVALGEVKLAVDHCTKAFALAKYLLGSDHAEMGNFYNTVGKVSMACGDLGSAELMFAKRIELARRDGPPEYLAEALFNLGSVRLQQHRYPEARVLLAETLRLESAIPELQRGLHNALSHLGLAYLGEGNLPEGRRHLEKALASVERHAPGDAAAAGIREALKRLP